MTAPTVDTPDDVGEDRKFSRLLNAFGKAYHDYVRADSTKLRFAGAAVDAARDAVEDYVGSRLLAARREVKARDVALRRIAQCCWDTVETNGLGEDDYADALLHASALARAALVAKPDAK